MIWFLRHLSVRLWLVALVSMPASIYLVFRLNGILTDINPIILFISVTLFFFAGTDLIMNLIGKKLILSLIKEGMAWERAEIYTRSEEKYYKALRIYDSFLISPFSAKACAEKLSGAMARLIAISETSNITFEKAATLFLKISPNDEHMALLWLKRLFHAKNLDLNTMDHDILTLIAENHYTNPKILPLLTNAFVQLERTDFTAQKVYEKALIYLKKESGKRLEIQNLIREHEEEEDMPSELSFAKASSNRPGIINLTKKISGNIFGFISFILSTLKDLFYLPAKHKKTKTFIKYSLIFVTLLLLIILLFTTLPTLFKNQPATIEPEQMIIKAPAPELPYTIQVAAFLSLPHAKNYTNKLTKTGLTARYVKVVGKNKTWFLVRISEFKDKSSAAAYGQQLKREGLIKDFFVANK